MLSHSKMDSSPLEDQCILFSCSSVCLFVCFLLDAQLVSRVVQKSAALGDQDTSVFICGKNDFPRSLFVVFFYSAFIREVNVLCNHICCIGFCSLCC